VVVKKSYPPLIHHLSTTYPPLKINYYIQLRFIGVRLQHDAPIFDAHAGKSNSRATKLWRFHADNA